CPADTFLFELIPLRSNASIPRAVAPGSLALRSPKRCLTRGYGWKYIRGSFFALGQLGADRGFREARISGKSPGCSGRPTRAVTRLSSGRRSSLASGQSRFESQCGTTPTTQLRLTNGRVGSTRKLTTLRQCGCKSNN